MGQLNHAATLDTPVLAGDREIVFIRLFDAPRDLVWKAWTDPKLLVNWWGPNGFTTTIEAMDVRVGGAWNLVMHGPDGTNYPNSSVFTEVVKPERLAYEHHGGREGGPDDAAFMSTVAFEAKSPNTTRVTLRMVFPTTAARNHLVREYGAIEGGRQTFNRLEQQLIGMADEGVFTISRVLDAPRDLVFKAWTTPKHLARWWGPKGCEIGVAKLDLQPGGTFLYSMRMPGAPQEIWGKFIYREISPPERLVFTVSFTDAEGNAVRSFFSQTWPLEVLNVLTLTEENGRTKLTLRGGPVSATEEERELFISMFDSMQQGWGGTLDQLADFLKQS